ncbi:MAG: thiol reductant ABC exporter subunit CydC [Balneolaceae bacterium]|nr:MAG: thiol reductant ABC exporter subunit CydC [Balneolaceae bacterium]
MISRLLSYISDHRWQFTLALLLAAGTILAGMGLMSTSGYLISRAAQRPMIVDLFMVTAAVRFFGISRAVVRYFERVVSHDLTFRILHSMRVDLYRKFDSFSQKWLMGRRSGDLLSGIVSDIETLQNVYLRIISPVIVAALISILTFTGLAFFDLIIALTALAFLIFNGVAVPYLSLKLARGRGKTDITTRTQLKIFLVDRLQGLQDLLWMGRKNDTLHEFDNLQNKLDDIQTSNAGTSGITEGLNTLLSHLAMFSVLILAIPLVINGDIKAVWLAALTLGVLSSFEAVQGLANAFIQFENSQESSERVFSMAESGKDLAVSEDKNQIEVPSGKFEIGFRNVSFSYNTENITLNNISFDLAAGSKTAVVGPTGSGKSTLVNLLLGFWKPDKGQILANGKSIYDLDIEQLRKKFGVMSQDAYIFNRSLRENLLIANPDATDDQLRAVLHKVGLGKFAVNLDIQPGSQGMRFSGGERQLIALARVFLKESDFWIFDELTAHMDVNTERRVLDAIWSNLGNKSLLMITHRLVNMEKVDQIIVMDRGKIIEKGTHAKLLQHKNIYARMFELQNELIRDV